MSTFFLHTHVKLTFKRKFYESSYFSHLANLQQTLAKLVRSILAFPNRGRFVLLEIASYCFEFTRVSATLHLELAVF